MKRKLATAIALISAVTIVSAVSILVAGATAGTQTDPLVTVGYLNNIFRPQVIAELQGDITRAEQSLTQKFNAEMASFEARIGANSGTGVGSLSPADSFSVITLSRGQRLTASVGTEIMLRIGAAEAFGTAPALVNFTTAGSVSAGSGLETNHMYLVTIEGNGIIARADTVRVLVRGSFTVGS